MTHSLWVKRFWTFSFEKVANKLWMLVDEFVIEFWTDWRNFEAPFTLSCFCRARTLREHWKMSSSTLSRTRSPFLIVFSGARPVGWVGNEIRAMHFTLGTKFQLYIGYFDSLWRGCYTGCCSRGCRSGTRCARCCGRWNRCRSGRAYFCRCCGCRSCVFWEDNFGLFGRKTLTTVMIPLAMRFTKILNYFFSSNIRAQSKCFYQLFGIK